MQVLSSRVLEDRQAWLVSERTAGEVSSTSKGRENTQGSSCGSRCTFSSTGWRPAQRLSLGAWPRRVHATPCLLGLRFRSSGERDRLTHGTAQTHPRGQAAPGLPPKGQALPGTGLLSCWKQLGLGGAGGLRLKTGNSELLKQHTWPWRGNCPEGSSGLSPSGLGPSIILSGPCP